jgi:L-fuconolactonase
VESEPDDNWLIREDVLRGLRALAEHGLPFDLVVFQRHLKNIPIVAEKVPLLRMVLDHLGKPPIAAGGREPWASDIRRLAAIPNLYCKISGMVTESNHAQWSVDQLVPYVAHVIEQFGLSRLMWGSDWPVCLKAAGYRHVFDSTLQAMGPLTEPQRRDFFTSHAMAFYRLQCPDPD